MLRRGNRGDEREVVLILEWRHAGSITGRVGPKGTGLASSTFVIHVYAKAPEQRRPRHADFTLVSSSHPTMSNACATCALTFGSPHEPLSEKPLLPGRYLDCCGRQICSRCLNLNKRYENYCPHCQISNAPSPLPQGLKEPPAYSSLDDRLPSSIASENDELPAYSVHHHVQPPSEKLNDVLHFLRPSDTVSSLSLAYGVPINVLRKINNIFSDHLVQGRKTILIPGEYCQEGVSLSPQPAEGEEKEIEKNKLRRWMVACKVAE